MGSDSKLLSGAVANYVLRKSVRLPLFGLPVGRYNFPRSKEKQHEFYSTRKLRQL